MRGGSCRRNRRPGRSTCLRSATGVGSRVIQIGVFSGPTGVGFDPAMGVFLADVHRLGQLVPVAALEAVDHARRMSTERKQQRECTGEVLTMALLAVDQKVFNRDRVCGR